MTRKITVPEGQTPLTEKLGHPLLDVFNEGATARDNGTGSPYHGHSLEHCLHAAGWVQRDLRLALDAALDLLAKRDAELARLNREHKLAEAQVERLLALSTSMDSDFENTVATMWDAGARLVALYDETMRDLLGEDVHHGNPDSEEMAKIRRVFGLPALTGDTP